MIPRRFALLAQNDQTKATTDSTETATETHGEISVSLRGCFRGIRGCSFFVRTTTLRSNPQDLPDLRFAIETAVEIWIRELSVGHRNVDVYPEYALLVKRSGREDLVLRLAV